MSTPLLDEDGLTRQERRLVECAANGKWWMPGPDWPEMGPPTEEQDANRTIRAELIRCLATGDNWPSRISAWKLNEQGITILEARIVGSLDLSAATVLRRLGFGACFFEEPIDLTDAESRTLSFGGSIVPHGFNAVRARIRGALYLREGFIANSQVNLSGARVEGDLDCRGGQFNDEGKIAFRGDTMIVGGSVFFNEGFTAKGEVQLLGVKIEGQLACTGGHFENKGRTALNGDAMTVGADVFFRHGFRAEGMVNLLGAKIGGQLACTGGHFENEGKVALNGDAITVGADVFLRSGFTANGEVNFYGAIIKGNLSCEQALFVNANGDALDLTQAEIGAGLFLRDLQVPNGEQRGMDGRLVLEQAKCRTYSDDESAWPKAGKLLLDGFTFERFHNCATLWEKRAAWLHLQPDDHKGRDFRPQPWIQAANVLRQMGHERDARELSVERERVKAKSDRIKRKDSKSRWQRRIGLLLDAWNWILRATIGYGYMPWRVLYWSTGIVLFGWLVFAAAGDLGYMSPRDGAVQAYLASHPNAPVPDTYIQFNAFVYALDAFLPIIELDESQGWEPDDEQHGYVRPLGTDEGWGTCTKRLMTGQNMEWRPTAPPSARACGYTADTGLFGALSAGATWLFRHGVHRAVDWLLELLGWTLVSLFIAGMSGIMKKE